ncbi:MAG: hypothetical protein OER86_12555 [Phycisphaerae bacterium]|nr:hypothetical protein [Phycisphaerae bacterium]
MQIRQTLRTAVITGLFVIGSAVLLTGATGCHARGDCCSDTGTCCKAEAAKKCCSTTGTCCKGGDHKHK